MKTLYALKPSKENDDMMTQPQDLIWKDLWMIFLDVFLNSDILQ